MTVLRCWVDELDPLVRIAAPLCPSGAPKVLKEDGRFAQRFLKTTLEGSPHRARRPKGTRTGERGRILLTRLRGFRAGASVADRAQTSQLRIGAWLVTPALDQIERAGETVKLEPRTMRLLLRLSETPGEVVSGQLLLDDVWTGVVVGSQSVYQAISQLRKLLGDVE